MPKGRLPRRYQVKYIAGVSGLMVVMPSEADHLSGKGWRGAATTTRSHLLPGFLALIRIGFIHARIFLSSSAGPIYRYNVAREIPSVLQISLIELVLSVYSALA